jgi:hypothetical protein
MFLTSINLVGSMSNSQNIGNPSKENDMRNCNETLAEIKARLETLELTVAGVYTKTTNSPSYPYYLRKFDNGRISKFLTPRVQIVVDPELGSLLNVGDRLVSTDPVDFTEWEHIAFDSKRGIADKQLVECSDNIYPCQRIIRFYDAVNHTTFNHKGARDGSDFDEYEVIHRSLWPAWAVDAYLILED